jgi:uncharacterized protein involved in exopolysaccharide biosynthesis
MNVPPTDATPSLQQILIPVWAQRKRILLVSLAVGLLTLGINFLLPKWYRATAVLLPESDKNKLGAMSQFAGLASLAGVNMSGGDLSRLYPAMLTSESILRCVVERKYRTEHFKDSVTLIQYFELDDPSPRKNMDDALREVKGVIVVTYDAKTSVVSIGLEMPEPQLAADVLNALLAELDMFLRDKKMNNASEQRKWVESRLVQVDEELRDAEERVKDFREKNRRVTDSPSLLMQQERLLRDVQIKSTIAIELRKQAEIAKIEEIKQVTTINILDEGRAPIRKEHPKRGTNALLATTLCFLLMSTWYATGFLYGEKIAGFIRQVRG